MNKDLLIDLFREASSRSKVSQQISGSLSISDGQKKPKTSQNNFYLDKNILQSLRLISSPLADSYLQIIADFDDENRISWAGTAHEIRELIRKILEKLAPTKKVEAKSWYKKQTDTNGPTQKQRVKYILSIRKSDEKQQEVAENIDIIDDKIGKLVRDVYGRASDAAHRSKNKAEAFKILRYFEAFAYDLLDL